MSRKALDSGPGSRRLRTEDSPVSDGGGREGEPELGIWDLTLSLNVASVPLFYGFQQGLFLGKNS